MKDELIASLRVTSGLITIMDFVTAVNKTNSLSASVLPREHGQDHFIIEIFKFESVPDRR